MTLTPLPVSKLTFEEAKELGELVCVLQDLNFVVEATGRMAKMEKEAALDYVMSRSLFTAALVAYVRCFTACKRVSIGIEVFSELEGDPIGCHQMYKDTRDKHIAHSVNPFKEVHVVAVLSSAGVKPPTVEGTGWMTSSLIGYDLDGLEQLGGLAAHAHAHLRTRLEKLQAIVLEKARQQDIRQLVRTSGLRVTPQGGPEVAKTPR